ncbi:Gfo/Idh/MocA family protein [Microbacterium sp. No. 7]|uniref:Gfo/Idh/MocA family protein n=1 Tax=Microbacterium sp. No. 7 TaxID=1714373 RepID=UPI0006D25B23|nr:Gfo/Idh/MocA family oxidoreductase [Microbacterium sp. No. 7]ALJ21635.1 oxidoreductase [Microbacterium sp. No. 7]
MDERARWAVLGPGEISGFFARSLRNARLGGLHAVGSRDAVRARAFADEHGARVTGTYDEVIARDDVDAVYIGTVHTTHADLALAALDAGKAVLCEKPAGVTAAETERVLERARERGLPFVEAFKYRFGPFPALVRGLVASGELGALTGATATLGSRVENGLARLTDPATAGGAILDMGCYPVSLAVGLAAWSGALDDLALTDATGIVGDTGVDVHAEATVTFGGAAVRVACSFVEALPRSVTIAGTRGSLEIPNVWGSRAASTDGATLHRVGGTAEPLRADVVDPMAAESDAVILALREGRTEASEMPWAETRATARLLDAWLAALR